MTVERERKLRHILRSMEFGDDYNGKLKPLSLMDRHQLHRVRSLVHLAFTLTSSNRFKLFDVTNKVANQVIARAFITRRKSKQSVHVRESLCAVKVRGNHREVLRFGNCEA